MTVRQVQQIITNVIFFKLEQFHRDTNQSYFEQNKLF